MAIPFEQWEEEFQRGLHQERIVRERIDPFHLSDVHLCVRFREIKKKRNPAPVQTNILELFHEIHSQVEANSDQNSRHSHNK